MEDMCIYRFGPFVLNAVSKVLLRDEVLVPLFPAELDVLVALISGAGQVVTKRELMHKLWPNTFVEESSMSQDVSRLRIALEGAPSTRGAPRYSVTVATRGYRCVGSGTRML